MMIHVKVNSAEAYIKTNDSYTDSVYSLFMMLNTIANLSDRAEVSKAVCEMIDQIIDAENVKDAYLDWEVHGYADEYSIYVNRV